MKTPALALLVAAGLPLLASCGSQGSSSPASTPASTPAAASPAPAMSPASAASAGRFYPAIGVVKGFQSDNKVIIIHNQDIPGFMDEMTMPYELQDPGLAQGLKEGDAVDFTITARDDDYIVTAIQKRRP